MALFRRAKAVEPDVEIVDDTPARSGAPKGRPTPKRRQSAPARGPAAPAPRTRKEAVRYQRERLKAERAAEANPATRESRRAAMLSGETLRRQDQGEVKQLARDFVDSRRLLSNYLLVAFPFLLLSFVFPILGLLAYALIILFLIEWFIIGRRIRNLALARDMTVREGLLTVAFYSGSRAYLPRRWRLPRPRVSIGDTI